MIRRSNKFNKKCSKFFWFPRQMLQRLAVGQVRAGNNLQLTKWNQTDNIFFVSSKRN